MFADRFLHVGVSHVIGNIFRIFAIVADRGDFGQLVGILRKERFRCESIFEFDNNSICASLDV